MSINEALQLVDDMKKRGVLEFSFEGLTIKFDVVSLHMDKTAEYVPPAITPEQRAALEKAPQQSTNLVDQDLYWSV